MTSRRISRQGAGSARYSKSVWQRRRKPAECRAHRNQPYLFLVGGLPKAVADALRSGAGSQLFALGASAGEQSLDLAQFLPKRLLRPHRSSSGPVQPPHLVSGKNLGRRSNPGFPVIGRVASRPCDSCIEFRKLGNPPAADPAEPGDAPTTTQLIAYSADTRIPCKFPDTPIQYPVPSSREFVRK